MKQKMGLDKIMKHYPMVWMGWMSLNNLLVSKDRAAQLGRGIGGLNQWHSDKAA